MKNKIKNYKQYRESNIHKLMNEYIIDNRYYYVYRITDLYDNTHYYGSRVSTITPKLDLGITYKSSSTNKQFLINQNTYKTRFKYKIIKIFDNNIDKILYESFIHQYFDVKNHCKFINLSNCAPNGFDTTGYVACLNLLTNKFEYIDKEKFKNNPNLVGVIYNKINCLDLITNTYKQVDKYEFENNPNLVGVAKNKVAVINTKTNKTEQISIEEFSTNDNYISVNKNKVVCKDINTNIFISVSKEEFDNNPNLVGTTYGAKLEFTDKHKANMSKGAKGKKKSEEHIKNLSEANKNKVACKLLGTNNIIFVSKEEFDNNPNLVGTTKNTDKYTIKTPNDEIIILICKENFLKFCNDKKISTNSLLLSLEYNMEVQNNKIFVKKTFNERIKNAIGYKLVSIEKIY